MKNGEFWYDTDGNIIHAHGGWMLKVDDYYYWYGEDRTGVNLVSCYRTKDFKNFEFRNHVLTVDSSVEASYLHGANLSLKTEETDDNPNNQLRRRDENGLVFSQEFDGKEPFYAAIDAQDCKYYRANIYNVTKDYIFAVGNPIWNEP